MKEIIVWGVQGGEGGGGWWCEGCVPPSPSPCSYWNAWKCETHPFLCSCALGVGWWWVVGLVGVCSISISNSMFQWTQNKIVLWSVLWYVGVVGVVWLHGVFSISISLSMLVLKCIKKWNLHFVMLLCVRGCVMKEIIVWSVQGGEGGGGWWCEGCVLHLPLHVHIEMHENVKLTLSYVVVH